MKLLAEPVLPIALPLAALVAAGGLLAVQFRRPAPPAAKSYVPAELLKVVQGKRRFTEEDIPVVVEAMHRAGIENFVCRIDPASGEVSVALHDDLTPHLDIKPGSCPNPIQIRGGGVAAPLPTGVLGNAFDVTQVDINTVRMSRGSPAGMFGAEVAPTHITFADVGTPFDGKDCQCAALGPDGILDLSLQYDKQQVINALGLGGDPDGADVPLRTTGLVSGGVAVFSAVDCVRIQQH